MSAHAAPTEAELKAANCWFPKTDRVSGDSDMTAFRQQARLHQARWRDSRGYPEGTHAGRDGTPVPNGSKLAPNGPIEEDFRNFLDSTGIRNAVHHRSEPQNRETGEQFRTDRLRYDLLSSMPMCFNLFGELFDDAERLSSAGEAFFDVDRPAAEVRFEHSPGRQNVDYTNDGTAFDVALLFGDGGGPRTIVGIETKFHEHVEKVATPNEDKMRRYREIAERAQDAGIFKPGWTSLLGTELQQIWRDHLLLLSMLQLDDTARWASGKYVLVHPDGNTAFADVGRRYMDLLDDDSTFSVMTVEELLAPGVLHAPGAAQEFRERYLW